MECIHCTTQVQTSWKHIDGSAAGLFFWFPASRAWCSSTRHFGTYTQSSYSGIETYIYKKFLISSPPFFLTEFKNHSRLSIHFMVTEFNTAKFTHFIHQRHLMNFQLPQLMLPNFAELVWQQELVIQDHSEFQYWEAWSHVTELKSIEAWLIAVNEGNKWEPNLVAVYFFM